MLSLRWIFVISIPIFNACSSQESDSDTLATNSTDSPADTQMIAQSTNYNVISPDDPSWEWVYGAAECNAFKNWGKCQSTFRLDPAIMANMNDTDLIESGALRRTHAQERFDNDSPLRADFILFDESGDIVAEFLLRTRIPFSLGHEFHFQSVRQNPRVTERCKELIIQSGTLVCTHLDESEENFLVTTITPSPFATRTDSQVATR